MGREQPTAWFDELYAEGLAGAVSMPWDRVEPQVLLKEWAGRQGLDGTGRTAVVVGCGLGADAVYLASLGFTVTAFDVAPTAVEVARERFAGSGVDFRVADLLALPPEWQRSFDLVVEIFTLQALPEPPRSAAAQAVTGLVADGGTLLAIAFRADGSSPADAGPPFPLERGFVEGLARDGLEVVLIEELDGARAAAWRATYRR
ncbi:class I SAM-dependent methyltransferase [Nocardioides guangzhouensis]|uniref:Class I SAM-dependent methyltransferase n=1 Tax=Nocardioides guangzhouensis TaxID=2497878 RepID=A0A4Q4Z741_9ACTN|nr:class I SAM-dependent methyltransferase [Nocardioides guangzhouensis]